MKKQSENILIVDDNDDLRELLADTFKEQAYTVYTAATAEDALKTIYTKTPHLIIVDLILPGMNGIDFCKILKKDIILSHIPVIIISGKEVDLSAKLKGIQEGAIDYVIKPFFPQEILAKVASFLQHTHYEIDANPLTKLPGNSSCLKAIDSRIRDNKPFAVCYADIDNFKAYNDTYGFQAGDKIIQNTSSILKSITKSSNGNNTFLGHLGGDDFLYICPVDKAEKIAKEIVRIFDKEVPRFYSKEDNSSGFIVQLDREGTIKRFPLMSLSIAIVHNKRRSIKYVGQVSKIAAELKKYAKSKEGSSVVIDRRTNKDDVKNKPASKADTMRSEIAVLKKAIKDQDIHVVFQPIISLESKKEIGYELLARGPHNSTIENPETIFLLAENADLVKEVDTVFLKKTLDIIAKEKTKKSFFINLKAQTLNSSDILQKVLSEKYLNLCHDLSIKFEIPEKDIFNVSDQFLETIAFLKSKCIKIAIDDVGKGATSFRDITKIKPDYIKIDISLIRDIDKDPDRQNILESILRFAEYLKIEVIAEGIETEEEFSYLLKKKISYGQGFLISKPVEII